MRRSLRQGLTLAELVIAVGLIAMAALGLLAAFTSGLKLMQQSTNLTMATEVAREVLEGCKARGYAATELGDFDGRAPVPRVTASGFPPPPYPRGRRSSQEFVLRLRCSQHSVTTRLIQVEVFWGRTHRTSLTTMVHR